MLGSVQSGDLRRSEELLSVGELQSELWSQIDASLASLTFSDSHQLLSYGVTLDQNQSLSIELRYLGDRPIAKDAQDILRNEVRRRLALNGTEVKLTFFSRNAGEIVFRSDELKLTPAAMKKLDEIANGNFQILLLVFENFREF